VFLWREVYVTIFHEMRDQFRINKITLEYEKEI